MSLKAPTLSEAALELVSSPCQLQRLPERTKIRVWLLVPSPRRIPNIPAGVWRLLCALPQDLFGLCLNTSFFAYLSCGLAALNLRLIGNQPKVDWPLTGLSQLKVLVELLSGFEQAGVAFLFAHQVVVVF